MAKYPNLFIFLLALVMIFVLGVKSYSGAYKHQEEKTSKVIYSENNFDDLKDIQKIKERYVYTKTEKEDVVILNKEKPRKNIRYIISPHPDDEVFSAGTLLNSPDSNTRVVIILMTQGEATSFCNEQLSGLDISGERMPKGKTCAEMRIDSWHTFLDTTTIKREDRYIFNFPDKGLGKNNVLNAFNKVRSLYKQHPIKDIVCACYYNEHEHYGDVYTHRDHLATRDAVLSLDIEAPLIISISPHGSDMNKNIDTDMMHNANMIYGWLSEGSWIKEGLTHHGTIQYFKVKKPRKSEVFYLRNIFVF